MRAHEHLSPRLSPTSRALGAQSGLTLVELLVAMTIGLLVGLIVTQAYLSGVTTQRSQNDLTRLQESARFALSLLSREIRNAGFRNTYAAGSSALEFCSTSAVPGSAFVGLNDPSTVDLGNGVTATVANRSDSITVRYYGEDNASGTGADNVILDCLGNPVRRGVLVSETLYIAADPANGNEPTLYCSTRLNGAGAPTVTPMVPGVESLQLLYGDDTDLNGTVNRYVPYQTLVATSAPDSVNSVMVSFVVRSPTAVASTNNAQSFNHFGGTYAPSNVAPTADPGSVFSAPQDRRIRLHFSSIVALRNFSRCE